MTHNASEEFSLMWADNLDENDMYQEYQEPTPHLYGRHSHGLALDDEAMETYVARTPSGSVYIPSDVTANTLTQYKTGRSGASPSKSEASKADRYNMAFAAGSAVLPSRPSLHRPPSDARFSCSKPALLPPAGRCCSWKLATLLLVLLCLVLALLLVWSLTGGQASPGQCPVDQRSGGVTTYADNKQSNSSSPSPDSGPGNQADRRRLRPAAARMRPVRVRRQVDAVHAAAAPTPPVPDPTLAGDDLLLVAPASGQVLDYVLDTAAGDELQRGSGEEERTFAIEHATILGDRVIDFSYLGPMAERAAGRGGAVDLERPQNDAQSPAPPADGASGPPAKPGAAGRLPAKKDAAGMGSLSTSEKPIGSDARGKVADSDIRDKVTRTDSQEHPVLRFPQEKPTIFDSQEKVSGAGADSQEKIGADSSERPQQDAPAWPGAGRDQPVPAYAIEILEFIPLAERAPLSPPDATKLDEPRVTDSTKPDESRVTNSAQPDEPLAAEPAPPDQPPGAGSHSDSRSNAIPHTGSSGDEEKLTPAVSHVAMTTPTEDGQGASSEDPAGAGGSGEQTLSTVEESVPLPPTARTVTVTVAVDGGQLYRLSMELPADGRPVTATMEKAADPAAAGQSAATTPAGQQSTPSQSDGGEQGTDGPLGRQSADAPSEQWVTDASADQESTTSLPDEEATTAPLSATSPVQPTASGATSPTAEPPTSARAQTSAKRTETAPELAPSAEAPVAAETTAQPSSATEATPAPGERPTTGERSEPSSAPTCPPAAAPRPTPVHPDPVTVTVTYPPPVPVIVVQDVQRKTVPPAGSTFSVVRLSESYAETLSPHGYWSMQFYLPDDAYVQWNSTVPRGASLAVYGRRNALPTHTQYDVHHLLRGYSRRYRRMSGLGAPTASP
ncbi:proteoglycan 4-like [Pollicipes pollicipes]|uniref:proteoglycan 4-like n=1 Tax=Pollicipes pollicipes TaxID=41117 RepID=UPI0018852356|nr:proteoglycan 4-like [Pollicipes pollicipes]